MATGDYRGKCFSTSGKRTKTGDLKRSGNFSYSTFHCQNLLYKDYYVRVETSESGIKTLIVGDHTPLALLMGQLVADLALKDERFELYQQKGKKRIGGKDCETIAILTKISRYSRFDLDPHAFRLRVEIYTDGISYEFPEY